MATPNSDGRSQRPIPATGIPVDASGGATVDPTKNVLDLVSAAQLRQDDLREAEARRVDQQATFIAQLSDVRERHTTELFVRSQTIAELHQRHTEVVAELRATHTRELLILQATHLSQMGTNESKRLDAVRDVDQLAASQAAQTALTAIQTLAKTTTDIATTTAATLASTLAPIQTRLGVLEQSYAESRGRQLFADPQIAELATKMDRLVTGASVNTGKESGISLSVALVGWALTFLVAASALLYAVLKS